jgi:hypothetical protein
MRKTAPNAPDPRPGRPETPEAPPAPPPAPVDGEAGYTDEEEAEVRKRLEDLGYVE